MNGCLSSYVLDTIRRFQRHFPNKRTWCRQTIMDNYNKYSKNGLSLNRNVGNPGVGNSGRSRTAQTQANIDMVRRALEAHPLLNCNTAPNHKPSFHLLKTMVLDMRQPSSYNFLLSTPFVCSRSRFHVP